MDIQNIEMTEELAELLDYVQTEVAPLYPNTQPSAPHFMLAVIDQAECMANDCLVNVVFGGNAGGFRKYCVDTLESLNMVVNISDPSGSVDRLAALAKRAQTEIEPESTPSSVHMVLYMITHDEWVKHYLLSNGITQADITANFAKRAAERKAAQEAPDDKPIRHPRKKKAAKEESGPTIVPANAVSHEDDAQLPPFVIPLFQKANKGELDPFVEDRGLYDQIFNVLSRKSKNNVLLVGDRGVGKTSVVNHLAMMIFENAVPRPIQGKKLVQLDIDKMLVGTSFRGSLEEKVAETTAYFRAHPEYLLFIDDVGDTMKAMNKNNQVDIEPMVRAFLKEPKVGVLCTSSNQAVGHGLEDARIMRYFQTVEVKEPTEAETTEILECLKPSLERYHGVSYRKEILARAPFLAKKYMTSRALPDSAIDLLDELGAMKNNQSKDPDDLREAKDDLSVLERALAEKVSDYDERDELLRERIRLRSKISSLEKRHSQNRAADEVCLNDLMSLVSSKTGIPVSRVTSEERSSLKNLESDLKSVVIGQDQAVGEVARAIKRKRVGLSSLDKPIVLFFGGSTGTGKTYLSKMLAKHVFGDEKNMVRMDMSEYGDKTSVNKILGASAGYVVYENGSALLEAVKKKNYCVVLLDEIEKADEQVHNTLLQIFDEGRVTDNHGKLVDFRNTIIIMTSNVGAKEVAERGNAVGYASSTSDMSEGIVRRALKRAFKPEFLNRIDEIVYFNKLTDADLKRVIACELRKIDAKLRDSGMSLAEDAFDEETVEWLRGRMENSEGMGARPILRMLQRNVEDLIADYVIDNDVEGGVEFGKDFIMSGGEAPPLFMEKSLDNGEA